jgi:HlyD family secretion protein
VQELLADEGMTVTKGQLLAKLTTDTLDAQLALNAANIARAEASIAVARSGIVQAEAAQKEAANALERAKPLKQSGYVSSATFDQRESAASTADAKLRSSGDSLTSAQADKAALEATRTELTWKRSRAEIRAPSDGLINRRSARVGAVASAVSDPMFRIIARSEVELDADVAESDVHKIKDGQTATVAITGAGDVTGIVRLISSEVDRTTRLGKVKVFFGTNPGLRLGAFGRGSIVTAKSNGLAVPSSALVFTPEGATVQAVVDGRVVTRPVKVGLKTQLTTEILSGLAEGETLVAKSGSFLRQGDRVRPVIADTKVSGAL